MKLFIQSLLIFFGTLFAAALVAFGEPVDAKSSDASQVPVLAAAPVPGVR
jgi:hypothetical protein